MMFYKEKTDDSLGIYFELVNGNSDKIYQMSYFYTSVFGNFLKNNMSILYATSVVLSSTVIHVLFRSDNLEKDVVVQLLAYWVIGIIFFTIVRWHELERKKYTLFFMVLTFINILLLYDYSVFQLSKLEISLTIAVFLVLVIFFFYASRHFKHKKISLRFLIDLDVKNWYQAVAMISLFLVFRLFIEGYSLMPSFGGDRTTQIVWVQKIINPEFGQGDFLLSSGYPLRNFFAIIIAIVAKFFSLNIAYFILTLAMSFLTMISFVIFFKKLNLLNFNESLVIAFAMSTLTFGRLGYSLGSGDTEHFNLVPRGMAFSLGIIGLAYLVVREKRPLLGSLYLFLSFLVQPLVVLYFLVILIILYLVLQLSEILKYKKLNLSHKNSILSNIILTVSYIIFFVVFQNNLSNFSLLLSLCFINFVIIINLIKFYIVLKESTFTYNFGIKIFTSLLLIFMLILFLLNYNFRSSTQFTFKYDSFLQSLRAYDLILTYFRSPLHADLENSSDKTIFFLGIFLLLIFLLFLKFSNLVGITPILVTFTILNIHFFMIILTDFFVKHSSLGGFQVLWPLSHTRIIYISIIFITVYFCKHFFRSNFLLLPTILGLSLLEFLYKEFSFEKEAFGQLVVLLLLLTLFVSKGAGSRENQNAQK